MARTRSGPPEPPSFEAVVGISSSRPWLRRSSDRITRLAAMRDDLGPDDLRAEYRSVVRYIYLGTKDTASLLVGRACDPVRALTAR